MNTILASPRRQASRSARCFQARGRWQTWAQVQLREASAESEFTGLTLTSRVTKGWGLISANYVLSKSMSDDDNERDSGGVQFENTYDTSDRNGVLRGSTAGINSMGTRCFTSR